MWPPPPAGPATSPTPPPPPAPSSLFQHPNPPVFTEHCLSKRTKWTQSSETSDTSQEAPFDLSIQPIGGHGSHTTSANGRGSVEKLPHAM